eukprot:s3073_g13.t1
MLASEAARWPSAVDQSRCHECMGHYAKAFWATMRKVPLVCGICALPDTAAAVQVQDLRNGAFHLRECHDLLSATRYAAAHATLYPSPLPVGFIGLPLDTLVEAGVTPPAPFHSAVPDAWLLHLQEPFRTAWSVSAGDTALPLHCPLCNQCNAALRATPARLIGRALANGNLCLPLPRPLLDLTFAEKLFLARGYTVKRLHTLPGPSAPADRQHALTGNGISFPQNAAHIVSSLPRHPREAAELLTVFFAPGDRPDQHRRQPYVVRRQRVLQGLHWLQTHNPFYADVQIDALALAALPEDDVPEEFFVSGPAAPFLLRPDVGPAAAQVSNATPGDSDLPLAAAVLDVEGEGLIPLHAWQEALTGSSHAQEEYDILILSGSEPLSSFALAYWVFCFPHLFPYGDGVAAGARLRRLPDTLWARHLLLRMDRKQETLHWSLDLDFVATLFGVLHRRELLRAVQIKINSPGFAQHAQALQALRDVDFAAVAQALEGAGGVQEALRSDFVSEKMKEVLRSMEIVSGAVPCTDASRRRMRRELRSFQIWHGLPSIFLTLNPADTRHPFTLYYSSAAGNDWVPVADDAALSSVLKKVNLLHLVASDPVAVARAFHEHVRALLTHLLDCNGTIETLHPDGVAACLSGGVLGPIAGYYGVTEPQLRGSLHIHMLIHLYAFTTPAAFATTMRDILPAFVQGLLSWVSSCVHTSLEALPRVWGIEDQQEEVFQHLQPLPYSQRQQDRLHLEVGHSWDFHLASTVWRFADAPSSLDASPPWSDPFQDGLAGRGQFLPWPRSYLCSQATGDMSSFVPLLLYDLRHSALNCCLHDCRARTCHKGFLGRLGYCRLGYWHWKQSLIDDAFVWQRCHGLPLHSRACVGTVYPHENLLLTERHHPYHTRFNAALLATAKCNHDVSVLVRAPSAAENLDASAFAAVMASSTQLATYYITAYMSKVQPHLLSLWTLLRQGQARLQQELREKSLEPGISISHKTVARRVLMRMLSASHRRVHKSMPEMANTLVDGHEEGSTNAQPQRLLPSNAQELDYTYRGEQLQTWPFYFYVAAVVRFNGRTYDADVLACPFDPRHPDRRGQVQRILLQEPWAIPHLIGASIPPKAKDPARRALLLLLLFKPWGPALLHDLLRPMSRDFGPTVPTWQDAWCDFQEHLEGLLEPVSERPTPFTPRYWAHRIMDIVAHIDALDGGKVDDNIRAIRLNPGVIRGDPTAAEYHAPGHGHSATDSDVSDDDVSPMSSNPDDDLPDIFCAPAYRHQFFATWDSVASTILRAPVQPNTPHFRFVRDFLAISSRMVPSPRHSPALHAPELASEELQVQGPLLRQQVLHWRRHVAEQEKTFAPSAQLQCQRQVVTGGSSPALSTAAEWLRDGCCTAPDGALNLKQAAFLLAFAARLLHHTLALPAPAPRTDLICLGGPGTGKTHMVKLILTLQHAFFPGSSERCCFMNSAARLIDGRTLHAALRLPRGAWTAGNRTLGTEKETLLRAWRKILLLLIDEVSMVPAELFSGAEFRAQQLKDVPEDWGGLSTVLTGDLMQLPPVAATSLATSSPSQADDATDPSTTQRAMEARRGCELWQNISSCIFLETSHRAAGQLDTLLQEMRAGAISDTSWSALVSRSWSAQEQTIGMDKFWSNAACVGVMRHRVRAIACVHRARHLAALAGQRLLLCLAIDSPRSARVASISDPALLQYLCSLPSLTDTKNLPGVLFLWHGCLLNLEEKIAEQYGLVRGCQGTLSTILFHDEEPSFDPNPNLEPHVLQFMPQALILQIPGGTFQQSNLLPVGACFLDPVTRDFQHTVNLDEDEYWMSVYVLFSRLRRLDDLILLRPPQRDFLHGGPPDHLQTELRRLRVVEQDTLQRLDRALQHHMFPTLRTLVTAPLLASLRDLPVSEPRPSPLPPLLPRKRRPAP